MIFKYLKKYIPFAILVSLYMIWKVVVDLTQPKFMEQIVDIGIPGTTSNVI